jgi:glutathione S-transferase
MLKLYYSPRTRAVRPRWLLEEMGIPYELVQVNLKEPPPAYLELQPHGAVPVLQDGEWKMFESAAMCLYLADRYPEKGMAPAFDSPLRGEFLQWMFYLPATLESPFSQLYHHTRGLPEGERDAAIAARVREDFELGAAYIERSLRGKKFLLGDRFSAADVVVAMSLLNARRYGFLVDKPELERYLTSLEERPARKRAIAD